METSLGNKLIKATGHLDGQAICCECDRNKVIQYLNETRFLINQKRKKEKINEKYKEEFIISSIFRHDFKGKESQHNYSNALYQVIDEFLDYFIKNYQEEHKPIIVDFVYELGRSEMLKEFNFFENWPFTNTPFTYCHFKEMQNMFLTGASTSNMSRKILSILGLRQSLELRFRRILGISEILFDGSNAKISHDLIPKFIAKNIDKFRIGNFKGNEFNYLWEIYKWTNHYIHFMISPHPVLVWKAFAFCEKLFSIPEDRPPNYASIHDSVIIKKDALIELRNKFEQEIKKLAIGRNVKDIAIKYGYIESRIEDSNEPGETDENALLGVWLYKLNSYEIFIPYKK